MGADGVCTDRPEDGGAGRAWGWGSGYGVGWGGSWPAWDRWVQRVIDGSGLSLSSCHWSPVE